jgi:hypothetical protein
MHEASVQPAGQEVPAVSDFTAVPGSPNGSRGAFSQRIRHEDSAVLKLKGLPYTTAEQQLLEFFKGYNVKNIAFVYEPDGRPSGLVRPHASAPGHPPRWHCMRQPQGPHRAACAPTAGGLPLAGLRRVRDAGGGSAGAAPAAGSHIVRRPAAPDRLGPCVEMALPS